MTEPPQLVFLASHLKRSIFERSQQRISIEQIVGWAMRCEKKYAEIGRLAQWWITSAIEDLECLDAATNMIRNGGP